MAKVALNTMVAPETLEAIRAMATGKSQGQVVDEAIAALQGGDRHGEVNRWFRETWGRLDEILETVQTVPTSSLVSSTLTTPDSPAVGNRPKNAMCKHCGEKFAGARFATICPGCKSIGHTLTPAECPVCGEGFSI